MCIKKIAAGMLILCGTGPLMASELMIYPKDGQDDAQQEQDNYQCYSWAKGESSFDPMAQPEATAPPPQQQAKKGGLARGALRGAAVGGIIDGSDGAKTGAAALTGAAAAAELFRATCAD